LVLDSGFVGYYAQNVVKVFVPVQVQKEASNGRINARSNGCNPHVAH
jgi:hypothetical protein